MRLAPLVPLLLLTACGGPSVAYYSVRDPTAMAVRAPSGTCAFRLLATPPSDAFDELAFVTLLAPSPLVPGGLTNIRSQAGRAVCEHGGDAFVVMSTYWGVTGEVIRFRDPANRASRPPPEVETISRP